MFNSRPPPTGSYVSRVSAGRNLRSAVLLFAFLGALYSLFAAVRTSTTAHASLVHDNYRLETFGILKSKLGMFSLVLGILYITIFGFEVFGIAATVTQRHQLVWIYSMLSFATVLIASGASLLTIIIHFTMKSNIIDKCTNLVEGSDLVFYPFGFFGPTQHTIIDQQDAQSWCESEWDHDSWADIVALLFIIASPPTPGTVSFWILLALPMSFALPFRGPASAAPFPSHYNQAYNASVPSLGYQYGPTYGQQPAYAPPPGPPPAMGGADAKAPDYTSKPSYGGYDYNIDDNAKENPFADFDEPTHRAGGSQEEHDVTSRPAPGGRDTFV
ncbi:hypothetical protein BT96DRAFT_988361 [Gymnopus androsaceus JB14]|uniref:Uncharacterized protein n=1 Tax=Gymnopus androsaceus JB14 TaxID=1447944 RepID=A0A6A4I1F1_9AGAR|nr:hypothetical protein BT96DRAFT_988361 [Gymnopus androsaceus JB14]